jgi:hypothetical protein
MFAYPLLDDRLLDNFFSLLIPFLKGLLEAIKMRYHEPV